LLDDTVTVGTGGNDTTTGRDGGPTLTEPVAVAMDVWLRRSNISDDMLDVADEPTIAGGTEFTDWFESYVLTRCFARRFSHISELETNTVSK